MFNEKQRKPFVSLSFIGHTITVICLAQAIEALYGANVNLFYRDTGSKQGWPIFFNFFLSVSLLISKPKHLFKENRQSKLLKVIV